MATRSQVGVSQAGRGGSRLHQMEWFGRMEGTRKVMDKMPFRCCAAASTLQDTLAHLP